MITKPAYYPEGEASCIYDAGSFRIGESRTVHLVKSFPWNDLRGQLVTAKCGTWAPAWTTDHGSRYATWAGVWESADECPRCFVR